MQVGQEQLAGRPVVTALFFVPAWVSVAEALDSGGPVAGHN
jgi:hypothetical protein